MKKIIFSFFIILNSYISICQEIKFSDLKINTNGIAVLKSDTTITFTGKCIGQIYMNIREEYLECANILELLYNITYEEDIENGFVMLDFHRNLIVYGEYLDGIENGLWTYYYSDSTLYGYTQFINGKDLEAKAFHKNGHLSYIKCNNITIRWNRKGEIINILNVEKNDKKEGFKNLTILYGNNHMYIQGSSHILNKVLNIRKDSTWQFNTEMKIKNPKLLGD